jgi:hypothetical protein
MPGNINKVSYFNNEKFSPKIPVKTKLGVRNNSKPINNVPINENSIYLFNKR